MQTKFRRIYQDRSANLSAFGATTLTVGNVQYKSS